jgi:hypothetical protein
MGGTGDILAELWEVSVDFGDELTVFGVSCRSRDAPNDLQFLDELCWIEVPAFWKKSIPQFSSNVKGIGKGKAVPLQTWSGPEGSRKLRFPDFLTTAQDGGKVVSPMHRPHLPPGNTPGTHFC